MRHVLLSCMTISIALLSGAAQAADTIPSVLVEPPSLSGTLHKVDIDAHAQKIGYIAATGQAKCDVDIYRLNYKTPDIFGKPATSTGALFIPKGAGCEGPLPLVVYARGTELDQQYTLSKLDNEGALRLAETFASQGYAVVASDYLGFAGSSSPYHPYFSRKIVPSIIDSYYAALNSKQTLSLNLSGKVFFAGHSQGGYNITAAVEHIEKSGLAIPVDGVAPLSGVSRPSVLYRFPDFSTETSGFQHFVMAWSASVWQKIDGNVLTDPASVFQAPYAQQMSDYLKSDTPKTLTPFSTDVMNLTRQQIYQDKFWDDFLHNDKNPVAAAAIEEDIRGWKSNHDWLFCIGRDEEAVRPELFWEPLAREMIDAGSTSVKLLDVDTMIKTKFNPVPKSYTLAYHAPGTVVACSIAARQYFDRLK